MSKISYRQIGGVVEGSLMVTVQEAAMLLGVSECLIREMIKRSELPIVRLGRLIRVPKVKLMALINGEADSNKEI